LRDEINVPCLAFQIADVLGSGGMALRFRYLPGEDTPPADTMWLVLSIDQARQLRRDITALLQRRGIATE